MSTQNQEINVTDERNVRLKKLEELKELGINPYPAKCHRVDTLKQALEKEENSEIVVAGRIMTKRDMGKLTFCHLQDETAKMQIALKQGDIDEESYKLFIKKIF